MDLEQKETYTILDPDKPFNIHLNPPSTERPPLVEIKQEGKASIYTTDFYFTNKLPFNVAVLSPGENTTMPTGDQAAAADPTLFDTDPLQPGKIHLHSWMLYTSQASILDLTGEQLIKTKKTLKLHFMLLIYVCKKTKKRSLMAEKKQEEPANQSKPFTGSDTSDYTEVNPRFKISVEER